MHLVLSIPTLAKILGMVDAWVHNMELDHDKAWVLPGYIHMAGQRRGYCLGTLHVAGQRHGYCLGTLHMAGLRHGYCLGTLHMAGMRHGYCLGTLQRQE